MTKFKQLWYLICLLGLVLIAGCSYLPLGQATDCSTPTALFSDDFIEDRDCGWSLYDSLDGRVSTADGVLKFEVSTTGAIAWSNPDHDFGEDGNVEISVQARQSDGTDNNAYGIICRYRDEDNFYVFLISGDGYYAIGKFVSGENDIIYLTGEEPVHYVRSEEVNLGIATNKIRAQCKDDTLTLFVNGFMLDQVVDDSHRGGGVGLAVSVLEPGEAVVEFDDFWVVEP